MKKAQNQVATMDAKEESVKSKKVQCLQLLLLLIPEPNYKLLKDLMGLLKRVTDRQGINSIEFQQTVQCDFQQSV